MLDPLLYVASVFVAIFLIYVVGRLLFVAYFRAKREFMRDLWSDVKGGKDDGV